MTGLHHGIWIQVCDVFPVPPYEFVVIKCKVVLVVILYLEKQKKGKRAKTISKFNSQSTFWYV